MGHDPGGFQLWWRQLTGSDATLDNAQLADCVNPALCENLTIGVILAKPAATHPRIDGEASAPRLAQVGAAG